MLTWSGDEDLKRRLDYMASKIDAKISYALNGMAYKVNEEIKADLPQWLHMGRGQRFITSSFQYDRSTPDNLSITVGALDRLPFIGLMEDGGTRHPQNRAIPIPNSNMKPIARGVKAALQRPNTFSGTVGGVGGVWQRVKRDGARALSLLYVYRDQTVYRDKHTQFYDTFKTYFDTNFDQQMTKALDELVSWAGKK